MRRLLKHIVVTLLWLPAMIGRWTSGAIWRCVCLAWARAHLGGRGVPLDNQILGLIDFAGTRRIRIGRNCRIYGRVRLETLDNGEIIIGDNVVLSPGTLIVARERITIGRYVMVGEYCSIRDQDHRTDTAEHVRTSGFVTSPISIGADVWIGRGCAVLKGVTIGENAVVAANSVVTQSVPAMELWAGIPARFVRRCGAGRSV